MGNVPSYYRYLQMKLSEQSNSFRVVSKEKANIYLGFWKIHKQLRNRMIEEMCAFGLLEYIDHQTLRIINCADVEEINKNFSQVKTRDKKYIKLIL